MDYGVKRYYFTYFDRNYLIKGLALIESLQKHETNDYEFFVVCVDEYTRLLLNRLEFKNVNIIPLHEVEKGNPPLNQAKRDRNLVEYYWSLKAVFALYILERHPRIELLTYFDADLFFYSTPQPLFEEMGGHSVLIHGHRFAPEQKTLEKYGRYNAGFFSVRNDTHGLAALKWWQDQCMQWCYARLEDGKYGDQLYLDSFPKKLKGVGELEHIGAGVAPWNHFQYTYSRDAAGNAYVNGVPLVFYHFHSLTFIEPEIIIPSKFISNPLSLDILNSCFVPYVDQLHQSIKQVRQLVPDFKFGLFNSQILTEKHTFIAGKSQSERIKSANLPQEFTRLNDTWGCYGSDQLKISSPLNGHPSPGSSGSDNLHDSALNSSENVLSYARSEFEMGNRETAISLLKKFTETWPDNYLMDMTLGEMLWLEGEQEAAVEHLLKAYDNKPNDHNVAAKLFNMLVQTEAYGTAKKILGDNGARLDGRLWGKGLEQ